jgi:thiosulfate dehydrogenase [quinone] large subunit
LQNLVLPNAVVFSYAITFGEVLVALGLIFGCLTGIAAFFGLFMNLNFMLAGAVSINPVIGTLAIFLVLAWRIGGYIGLDRYVLPLLGTPWTGSLARNRQSPPANQQKPVCTQRSERSLLDSF